MQKEFWKNRKVFITGHTGFKGSWMTLLLSMMGAEVYGYALSPNTEPNMFTLLNLKHKLKNHFIGDIRNLDYLHKTIKDSSPEVIIHMAAQPLVRYSYENPVETYETNVMGTVNILEAFKKSDSAKVLINVTTDKCYENQEWCWGYRENDRLGGYDAYSNSKACSELVSSAYRSSFMNPNEFEQHGKTIATARAGNVIGGGDWSADRLIPDLVRNVLFSKPIIIRCPEAIRPWQHVLEPISGYLMLGEALWNQPREFSGAWNFGPEMRDCQSVKSLVDLFLSKISKDLTWQAESDFCYHEAHFLKLDISKAKSRLQWQPKWDLSKTIDKTAEWYLAYKNKANLDLLTQQHIDDFFKCI